jgi:hypothetical protein
MEFGANKYTDGNWKLGGKPDEEYLDSAARHLDLFLSGEIYDQDSGCHHLGHVIWNYCALMELNYKDTSTIDKELFAERMAYWAAKKEGPSPELFVTLPPESEIAADPPVSADGDQYARAACQRGAGRVLKNKCHATTPPGECAVDFCPECQGLCEYPEGN